jgi:hypothetical protein
LAAFGKIMVPQMQQGISIAVPSVTIVDKAEWI